MKSTDALNLAVSRFGAALKSKLSGKGVVGAPEDQLRAPFEGLLADMASILLFKAGDVVAVGESTLSELKTRPDYAVKVGNALVGFVEVKAPGKGADPRRFKDEHDRAQWEKLKSLPNLMYTDGNSFSLWRGGKIEGEVVRLEGDVETAGAKLAAPGSLERLFSGFLRWEPIPPTTPRALAEVSAGLCRLLRDEVTEQLGLGTPALTGLAEDWRRLLFPHATDEEFADGYAQAVTFGLLMAKAQGISLNIGMDRVARALAKTNTVIGGAFRVLTDEVDGQDALKTSLATLLRVLDSVDWAAIGKGDPEAWLYFYEHFLEAYDNALRKLTGSYYTPPEVVTAMVRLVDEALRDPSRFGVPEGAGLGRRYVGRSSRRHRHLPPRRAPPHRSDHRGGPGRGRRSGCDPGGAEAGHRLRAAVRAIRRGAVADYGRSRRSAEGQGHGARRREAAALRDRHAGQPGRRA